MAQNQSMKTSMVIFSVLMIQLCCTVFDVSANSSGAPNWTCKTMKPGHGHQPSMPSPFTIDVNPLVITPGSAITVTLKSDGVRFFKGFLVTAFRSTGSGSRLDNLIGKFQGPPGTRETCHGKGYTHRNSQPKSNIVLTWTPPASMSNSDKLVFRVTFVEDHSKYWKDLSSVELTVSSFPDTAPASQSASASKPQPASDNAGAASNTPTFLTEDPKCGIEYSCFHDCYEKQCSFIVTWKDAGHSVAFQLKMMPVAVRERWIAVAFSHDVEMGDDSVTECMVDTQGSVKVYNSYNKAKTNHRLDNKIVGLSKMEGSFVNGLLECKFHRNKTSSYEPKLFDLNKLWYIMFSDGDALAGKKLPHSFRKLPSVTSRKMNLLYVGNVGAISAGSSSPLVKVHGCFMTIAWILLTSIGMITARYGKALWPNYTLFGLKIWFQIHRTAMVSVMCLTLLSFLIIVIEVKGISSIPDVTGKQYWQLHPWFGFMIVILSVANPIMALFRPGADEPGRAVFNWLHWAVGVFSVFLAVITVFIGLDLPKSNVSSSAIPLLSFSVIYLICVFLLMESVPWMLRKLAIKKTYQLNPRNSSYDLARHDSQASASTELLSPNKEKEIKVKTVLIICHYIIATVTSVALMLLMAL